MSELRKRPVSRRRVAAPTASLPEGGAPPHSSNNSATCGHSGCDTNGCNVRYVGPISHIRDHHAIHAARGVSHIWAATIITGFAIILTGAIAFQTAQARGERATASNEVAAQVQVRELMARLDRLEKLATDTKAACNGETVPESEESIQMRQDEARIRAELEAKKKLPAGSATTSRGSVSSSTNQFGF